MRRSHHKLTATNVVEDKKSGEYKLSHHIDLKSVIITAKDLRYLIFNLCQKNFNCNRCNGW